MSQGAIMDQVNMPAKDAGNLSREEVQRKALLEITVKTVRHFFGGFSPSVLWS
jgi:hypothetical protein